MIDVGYGQLAWSIRQIQSRRDGGCNARRGGLPDPIDIIVEMCLCLIKNVTGHAQIARPSGLGVLLIKPQFEVGRSEQ